jgi:hypothetical protein
LACAFLATPWTGRDPVQYAIAGVLLAIGVLLWGVTILVNRRLGVVDDGFDPEALEGSTIN